jgi:ubiquitin carboxyl-terminal hydrolase 5/13
MGFSENGSKRAAIATGSSDADVAMAWVLEHIEDEDFNSDLVQEVSPAAGQVQADASADPEALATLCSFGYTERQATAALLSTNNNLERWARQCLLPAFDSPC